ncbi:hypothetical protein F5B21DRAFT_510331 [Xylaria acuta]|nr:hypothetical protein F5B21DRAFT_510331 [Xylaria acuta]
MPHHSNTATTVCGQPAASEKISWCSDCFLVTLRVAAQLAISPDTQALLDPFDCTNSYAKVLIRALNLQDAIDQGHGHLFALVHAFVLHIVNYARAVQLYNINKHGMRQWPSDIARQDSPMTNQQLCDWLRSQDLPPSLPEKSFWDFLRLPKRAQTQHQASITGDQALVSSPALTPLPPAFQDSRTASGGNKPTDTSFSATGGTYNTNVHFPPSRSTTPTTPTQNVVGYQLQLVPSFLNSRRRDTTTPSPSLRSLAFLAEAGQPMTPVVPTTPRTNSRTPTSASAQFQLTPNLENSRRIFPITSPPSASIDRSLSATMSGSIPPPALHRQGYLFGPQAQPRPVQKSQGNPPDTQEASLADYNAAAARYFANPTKANEAELDRLTKLLRQKAKPKSQG